LIRSFYAIMDEDNPQLFEPETIWKWALARFMELPLAKAKEYSVRSYHLQFEAAKSEPPPCPKAPNRNIAPPGRYGRNGRLKIADALKKELEEGLQRYSIGRLSESESTEGKEDTDQQEEAIQISRCPKGSAGIGIAPFRYGDSSYRPRTRALI
jgi:hypothetical protein